MDGFLYRYSIDGMGLGYFMANGHYKIHDKGDCITVIVIRMIQAYLGNVLLTKRQDPILP